MTYSKFSSIPLILALGITVASTQALAEDHKGGKFKKSDGNGDGMLSRAELQVQQQTRLNNLFTQADTNKDGLISKEEMKAHRKNKKSLKNK
jgi:Ca2+-binding EF-hand superfamily protein